jgi:AcrR family transcriptional regulator
MATTRPARPVRSARPARRRGWRERSPGDADEARERLLDAAERCFTRWGPAKTTLEDIAEEAGVSRATVYRYLTSRVDLIIDLNIRNSRRGQQSLDARLGAHVTHGQRLVEIILLGRDWILEFGDPGLAHTLASSERFTAHSRDAYARFLDDLVLAGELRDGISVAELLEWILFVRVAIWSDDASPRDDLRQQLERFFLPAFVR